MGSATISFGLVSIPTKLFSATEAGASISFNLLHKECGSRLKQQYLCAKEGTIVERSDMVKGYEFAKDQYVTFSEGELEVSAQTQDVGEAKESLPAPFSGDTLEIGFNPEFLRDGIESVQSDEVRLKLISPLRPGLIQGEGDDYSYLIMPIRLAG